MPAAIQDTSSRGAPGHLRRVLVVDDDRDFAQSVTSLLETRGYDTRLAFDGDQARQAVQEFDADVALLDVRLGQENGLDLIADLRRRHPDILCVMITAYSDIESAITAVQGEAFDYLQKPVHPRNLLAALDRCFDRRRLAREKHSLEAQLHHAQRMEAIGRLAGGVAHDFNNLLLVILANTDFLTASLRGKFDPDVALEQIQQIERAGEQASALTRQLLAFSRRQVTRPEILELNATVSNAERMLQRLIGEDVRLTVSLGTGVECVRADAGQLEQVILNLAINARDAMPDGGELEIRTHDVELDDTYCAAHPDARPGPHAMLSVKDSGCGMDEATQARMFEPFFTTKAIGKGTGLGLSTVFGIVQQSEGHITVESRPGAGTTFKVFLPTVDSVPEPAKIPAASEEVEGSATILVCEDNESIQQLASAHLVGHGYTVLAATHASQALTRVLEHNGPIDLVLTDVILPDGNGRSVADAVLKMHPNAKVLYISGYTADIIARHGVLDKNVELLHKPFRMETLLARVRGIIER